LDEVAGGRDKKEETLWVPVSTFHHVLAFDHCDHISGFVGIFENAVVLMELIKWNVENALH
jgi:hypothetical protein